MAAPGGGRLALAPPGGGSAGAPQHAPEVWVVPSSELGAPPRCWAAWGTRGGALAFSCWECRDSRGGGAGSAAPAEVLRCDLPDGLRGSVREREDASGSLTPLDLWRAGEPPTGKHGCEGGSPAGRVAWANLSSSAPRGLAAVCRGCSVHFLCSSVLHEMMPGTSRRSEDEAVPPAKGRWGMLWVGSWCAGGPVSRVAWVIRESDPGCSPQEHDICGLLVAKVDGSVVLLRVGVTQSGESVELELSFVWGTRANSATLRDIAAPRRLGGPAAVTFCQEPEVVILWCPDSTAAGKVSSQRLDHNTARVLSMSWCSDQAVLACACSDSAVRLWAAVPTRGAARHFCHALSVQTPGASVLQSLGWLSGTGTLSSAHSILTGISGCGTVHAWTMSRSVGASESAPELVPWEGKEVRTDVSPDESGADINSESETNCCTWMSQNGTLHVLTSKKERVSMSTLSAPKVGVAMVRTCEEGLCFRRPPQATQLSALSLDSQNSCSLVASVHEDGSYSFWDVVDGVPRATGGGTNHEDPFTSVAWLPADEDSPRAAIFSSRRNLVLHQRGDTTEPPLLVGLDALPTQELSGASVGSVTVIGVAAGNSTACLVLLLRGLRLDACELKLEAAQNPLIQICCLASAPGAPATAGPAADICASFRGLAKHDFITAFHASGTVLVNHSRVAKSCRNATQSMNMFEIEKVESSSFQLEGLGSTDVLDVSLGGCHIAVGRHSERDAWIEIHHRFGVSGSGQDFSLESKIDLMGGAAGLSSLKFVQGHVHPIGLVSLQRGRVYMSRYNARRATWGAVTEIIGPSNQDVSALCFLQRGLLLAAGDEILLGRVAADTATARQVDMEEGHIVAALTNQPAGGTQCVQEIMSHGLSPQSVPFSPANLEQWIRGGKFDMVRLVIRLFGQKLEGGSESPLAQNVSIMSQAFSFPSLFDFSESATMSSYLSGNSARVGSQDDGAGYLLDLLSRKITLDEVEQLRCLSRSSLEKSQGEQKASLAMVCSRILSIAEVLQDIDTGGRAGGLDVAARHVFICHRLEKARLWNFRELVDGDELGIAGTEQGPRDKFLSGTLPSSQIAWALLSESKEALLKSCNPDGKTDWDRIKDIGGAYWLDQTVLRKTMEGLAKAMYLDKKDPQDSALMYIALGRKNILAALCRTADQPRLLQFFSRDFSIPENQKSALKNAYVLLSQHRYELSAAFFILGGQRSDAYEILGGNAGDYQLAFAVARLLEGDAGEGLHEFIDKHMIPHALNCGDAWFACSLELFRGCNERAIRCAFGELGVAHIESRAFCSVAEIPGFCKAFLDKRPSATLLVKKLLQKYCYKVLYALQRTGQSAGLPLSVKLLLPHLQGSVADFLLMATLVQLSEFVSQLRCAAGERGVRCADVARQLKQHLPMGNDLHASMAEALCLGLPVDVWGATETAGIGFRHSTLGGSCDAMPVPCPSAEAIPVRASSESAWFEGAPPAARVFAGPQDCNLSGHIFTSVCACATGLSAVTSTQKGLLSVPTDRTAESHLVPRTGLVGRDLFYAGRWPGDNWAEKTPSQALPAGQVPAWARLSISSTDMEAECLEAHPRRPLYLSGSAGEDIFLWQFQQRSAMATFTGAKSRGAYGRATDLSIHCSGERFASVAASGTVSLWHLETGGSERQVACTSSLGAVPPPRSVYTSARFLGGSSSSLLLSGAGDAGLSVWDSLAGRSFNFSVSGASPASVQKAVPLPGTSLIAVGSSDGSLTVLDLRVLSGGQSAAGAQIHRQTGTLWRSQKAHAGGVTSLLALPAGGGPLLSTGRLLVTGGGDHTLKVWDCKAAASAAQTAFLVQEVALPRAKTAGLQPGALVGNISQGIGKGPKASPGAGVHTLSLGSEGLYACTAGALAFLPLTTSTLPPPPPM